ncbi:MAG: hypothetical protein DRN68_02770 [Thaumarchaeota archaeon]|nr:MAG: hypothetical protein DRN68_02770 [Nitrososphaerota archaeon]
MVVVKETFLVKVRFRNDAGYRELVGWLIRQNNRRLYVKPIGEDGEEKIPRADVEDLEIMRAIYGE